MKTDRDTAELRLATYGTLAPGKPNIHQLDGLQGSWTTGTVRGHLVDRGWGAEMGYPAMIPDEAGSEIAVHVFHSADLPAHWARLDAFEGEGYARIAISVTTAEGEVWASIYIDRPS